jgi:signal peptidase II
VSGHSRRQIGRIIFYVAAVGALALDQVSKAIARASLEPGIKVEVVPGLFSLRLTENPGAAFGALGSWPPLLILIGLVAVLAIAGLRKERTKSKALAASLGLLLGGALSNLIDRLLPGHDVTDFLDFAVTVGGRSFNWPTFNLADVAITTGVFLLVYHIIVVEKRIGEETAEPSRK